MRKPAAGFCALAASEISTRPDDAPEPLRDVAAERTKETVLATTERRRGRSRTGVEKLSKRSSGSLLGLADAESASESGGTAMTVTERIRRDER
jgi:hypothetical protein